MYIHSRFFSYNEFLEKEKKEKRIESREKSEKIREIEILN